MTDLAALKARNAERWAKATLTRTGTFQAIARHLVEPQAKARYQAVEAKTGVPWFMIAVIHEREASQRWDRQLGQGDPLDEVSHNEPAGRGPFPTWEKGAEDALVNCAPHAARWTDWSPGGALTLLEQYNGLGYASGPAPTKGPNEGRRFPPQASPYIWSGTDQYRSGKFVADHDFRPEVVDQQLGCAGLIRAMMMLDSSIAFADGSKIPDVIQAAPEKPVEPVPSPPPKSPPAPAPTFWSFIASLFAALFKRK